MDWTVGRVRAFGNVFALRMDGMPTDSRCTAMKERSERSFSVLTAQDSGGYVREETPKRMKAVKVGRARIFKNPN